ncbi:hypothetical protein DFH09DRAFT_126171 [Mycena vulgaris]|nr:hypothetical protein DFH09DRAFT_126171 [Mycena vulgaris]
MHLGAARIPTRTRRPVCVCGTPAGAISAICIRRSTCSLHLRRTKNYAIAKGVACYYVYAAPPSDGGDVGCPSLSLIPRQREQRQRRRSRQCTLPMSRAMCSAPRAQQHPRANASPRRPPSPARSSDSPSTRPSRVFTPRPLGTSSSDDDDNGTEQHDRTQGIVLPRVRRTAYGLTAPASPFDATPQALIPRHREYPAPGPARQRQRRSSADPAR